jgi:DNA repair exonuclease SbcCD ATPase subunit
MMITESTTKSKLADEQIYDSNNYIKVIWEDTLDNHSNHKEKQIEKYFQTKYKTNKVKVIFKPITSKNSSVVVEGAADASELVLDENYQKSLIEQYIKDNNISVSLAHLMKLDSSVNLELENYKEHTNRYKTFKIKEIEFSNFLSYGKNNKITFEDKNGITSVISDPPNYGGKTTLTVDLLLFLFFGTTTKTDKNEEIFNRFSEDDLVEVKGKVDIEGDTYIIKRTISRKKSKDGHACKGEVDFYQVLPRGGIKQLNGEQRKFTDELIKTYVGTYDDFLITILTTGDNLDDLIKTKPTERGRILTRFIGLEFFREKEKIAKKKHTEWKEKSKLYHNNSQEILAKIDTENDKIGQNELMIISQKQTEDNYKVQINGLNKTREELFKTRYNDIDSELYKLDEETIQSGIDKVEGLVTQKTNEIKTLESQIPIPGEEYDIDFYGTQKLALKENTEAEITLRLEISSTSQTIDMLKNSEICQTCKRPLDHVDHKKEIADNEKLLSSKQSEWELVKQKIVEITTSMNHMDEIKNKWDSYNRNILLVDKAKVELKAYEDSLSRGLEKLNQYRKIKAMVDKNKLIDTDIQTIKFKIDGLDQEKNMVSLQIKSLEKDIELSKSKIDEYNGLLKELKNEEMIDNIFKVYLDVYGKNGISKMVLGTMIPLINSHLKILLSDTCEFILEMRMNEKSEVEFWMVDQSTGVEKPLNAGSGYEKTVSSLALRCVLSKVCSLPKPNIIVFDEVTGKVSNENLDKIGLFFDKLKQFFEHIWVISHNPLIQDWADHMVKVRKDNNISTLVENVIE